MVTRAGTLKSLRIGHAWFGIVLGCFVFVACVTGTMSLFRAELTQWSRSPHAGAVAEPSPTLPVSAEAALSTFARHAQLPGTKMWGLSLATAQRPVYQLLLPGRGGLRRLELDARDGRYLGVARRELGDFSFQLHANFSLRKKLGRYAVGLVGLGVLVLVVTGVLFHRHLWRDLFVMRWVGSLRRRSSDAHKLMGSWLLPLHVVLAFSGTVLALKDVLIIAPAAAVYRGDLGEARRALRPVPPKAANESAEMGSVDRMLADARTVDSRFVPTLITAYHWGDRNARLSVSGSMPDLEFLQPNEALRVEYAAASGSRDVVESGLEHGAWRRVFDAMTPLHYGTFGGAWIRMLYAIAGLGMAGLAFTGLIIWLDRRARAEAK